MRKRLRNQLIAAHAVALIVIVTAVVTVSATGADIDRTTPVISKLALAHRLGGDLQRFVSAGRRCLLTGEEADCRQLRESRANADASMESIARHARSTGADLRVPELRAAVDAVVRAVDRAMETLPHDKTSRLLQFEDEVTRIGFDATLERALGVPAPQLEQLMIRSARGAEEVRWGLLVGGGLAILIGIILTLMSLREVDLKVGE